MEKERGREIFMELYINIKDEKAEMFLKILKELKSDMIETFRVIPSQYVDSDEQKEIEEVLNNLSEEDKEIAFSKIIEFEV